MEKKVLYLKIFLLKKNFFLKRKCKKYMSFEKYRFIQKMSVTNKKIEGILMSLLPISSQRQ